MYIVYMYVLFVNKCGIVMNEPHLRRCQSKLEKPGAGQSGGPNLQQKKGHTASCSSGLVVTSRLVLGSPREHADEQCNTAEEDRPTAWFFIAHTAQQECIRAVYYTSTRGNRRNLLMLFFWGSDYPDGGKERGGTHESLRVRPSTLSPRRALRGRAKP